MPVSLRFVLGFTLAMQIVILGGLPSSSATSHRSWAWPISSVDALGEFNRADVLRFYRAPLTEYGAGHRGIDLEGSTGQVVVAPMSGIVSWTGWIGDRHVVSVQSGDTVATVEPVEASVIVGTHVDAGEPIGVISGGGHCGSTCLHLGVRVQGEYLSPLVFLGGQPRARLKVPASIATD